MNVYILTSMHVEHIATTNVVCMNAYVHLPKPLPTKLSHAIACEEF